MAMTAIPHSLEFGIVSSIKGKRRCCQLEVRRAWAECTAVGVTNLLARYSSGFHT
jgi:hypothetical protein